MLRNARREMDVNKRKAIVKDAQRYMAKKLYNVRFPGQVGGFRLSWPAMRNDRVYQGGQIEYYNVWIDAGADQKSLTCAPFDKLPRRLTR
jgi:hypothetical protein